MDYDEHLMIRDHWIIIVRLCTISYCVKPDVDKANERVQTRRYSLLETSANGVVGTRTASRSFVFIRAYWLRLIRLDFLISK